MRLVLHVGAHKTGTTAFQEAMTAARPALARAGVIYPDERPEFPIETINHTQFAEAANTNPGAACVFIDRVRREAVNDATVLISAEALYRHIDGATDWDHFDTPDYWKRRRGYLKRLRDVLGDLEVKPIIILRERSSFAQSLYCELTFCAHVRSDFASFLTTYRHWFDYDSQCAALRDAFGALTTIDYANACEIGIEKALFDAAALPRVLAPLPQVRVTPDVRLSLWLIDRGAQDKLRRNFVNSKKAANLFSHKVSLWTEQSRRSFMAEFDAPAPIGVLWPHYPALTAEDGAEIDNAYCAWGAGRA